MLAVLGSFLGIPAQAQTHIWEGGGADNNWSTAANWDVAAPAQPGTGVADLKFDGNLRLTPVVQAAYDINSLTFNNTANAFVIGGTGPLTIRGGGITNNDAQTQTLNVPLVVFTGQSWNAASGDLSIGGTVGLGVNQLTVTGANDATVSGVVSGVGGSILKSGAGILTLSGAAANTYSGLTTVNAGTLQLNKTGVNAIAGNLTIGDGTGSDLIQLDASNQIADSSIVTINSSGQLILNNFSETIGALNFFGGSIATGIGTLTMNGNLSAQSSAPTTSTITGNLNLGGVTRIFNVQNGGGAIDLDISAVISNGGMGLFDNGGTIRLSGTNTFTGGVELNTVNTLLIGSNQALGIGGTFVVNGGFVQADSGPRSVSNPVDLDGNPTIAGVFDLTFSGNVRLTGDRTLNVTSSGSTTLSGAINQSGANRSLTKSGTGLLILSGALANTYTGLTSVADGELRLSKNAGVSAIPGNLVIGNGTGAPLSAVVSQLAANQIANAGSVTLNTDGHWDLGGNAETVNTLDMAGGTVTNSAGPLTITGVISTNAASATATIDSDTGQLDLGGGTRTIIVPDGAAATDLRINNQIINGGITKNEAGTLELAGSVANTFTGTTTVNGGTLVLNKSGLTGAFPGSLGNLVVGDGIGGAGADIVRHQAPNQIANSSTVTINSSGLLDIISGGAVGGLSMTAGQVNVAGGGASLFLLGDLVTSAHTDAATISGAGGLNFVGGTRTITVADGAAPVDLDVSAVVESGGLVKSGDGTLRFSGSAANTYSGLTTVNAGTLILAKPAGGNALAGLITVGDAAGTDTLQLGASNQIPFASQVTVNSSGILDLAGFSESLSVLTVNGGSVTIGTGTLTISSILNMTGGSIASTGAGSLLFQANLNTSAAATPATISGNMNLSGQVNNYTIADGAAANDLDIMATITNGGITKLGAGTMQLSNNADNSVFVDVRAGTLQLANAGGAAVSGTIQVGDGVGGINADVVRYQANDQIADTSSLTIQSSGLVDLNGFSDTFGSFTMTGGSIATGAGILSLAGNVTTMPTSLTASISGNMNLGAAPRTVTVNDGAAGTDMSIDAALAAQPGGTLVKDGAGFLALTGTALSSQVSYQFDAGTLSANGLIIAAGQVFTHNGGTFAGALTNHGTFTYNGGAFNGMLTSDGTLNFNADFTAANGFMNQGSVTVASGRTLTLDGAGLLNAATGSIALAGGALAGSGPLVSSGVLSGNGTLGGSAGFSNSGQVTVSGGTLQLANTGANSNSGSIAIGSLQQLLLSTGIANTGLITLSGGSITGPGTLTNSAGGEVRGGSSVQGLLDNAGGLVHATGGTLTIANLVGNTAGGELRVDDGATLAVSNSFASSGTIVLAGANATFSGGVITNTGTLRGAGRVNNVVANSGTVRAENGTLTLVATGNSNGAAGRIEAGAGTQVLYSQGLATNVGQIALTGGALDNNNVALANSGQIEGYGTLRTGGLTNTGTISVGGSLDVLGAVTQNATVNTQSGSTVRFFGPVSGPGNYTGTGTTMFLNSFSPGASPALVSFGGDLILAGTAALIIDLAGTAPGTEYDRLVVAGSTTIAGALNVALLGGFTPSAGNAFEIIAAGGGRGGTFASTSLPDLGPNLEWDVLYGANTVTLQVLSTILAGDYNRNGTVDAADYVVWRNTLGQMGTGLAADGNNSGQIDSGDYNVWRGHFGQTAVGAASRAAVNLIPPRLGGPTATVPEPKSLLLLVASGILLAAAACGGRHGFEIVPSRRSVTSM